MTVTNPIHPLYGISVVVREMRKVGGQRYVIVESPLGGFLSLPESETDLFLQQVDSAQPKQKFLPQKLLRAVEWVAARKQSLTEESSCVRDDVGVEHREQNDTKASTANRSSRKLRKDTTADKLLARLVDKILSTSNTNQLETVIRSQSNER